MQTFQMISLMLEGNTEASEQEGGLLVNIAGLAFKLTAW